jgi:uncharacterized delta-60 repeat protein
MKLNYILLFLFAAVCTLHSQVVPLWTNIYDGPAGQSDIAYATASDTDGNIYVTGSVTNTSGRAIDCGTIKYNSSGDEQWVRLFNGPFSSDDYGRDITVDDSGNVYVTGETANSPYYDCFTIKYNSNGDSLWTAIRSQAKGKRIKIDTHGFIYVVGYTSINSLEDVLIIKYNSSGSKLWEKTFDGSNFGPDFGRSVDIDTAGNVYVAAVVRDSAGIIALFKYSSAGDLLFTKFYKTLNPPNFDDAQDIAVDDSGYIYICGSTGSQLINRPVFSVIKYNQNGSIAWIDKVESDSTGDAWRMKKKNGYIYVTGYSAFSATNNDYVTAKYNSSGRLWAVYYDKASRSDKASDLAVDDNGNTFVTGGSVDQNNFWEDLTTIKYDPDGNQEWVARYNDSANLLDYGYGITLDNNGDVIVCGQTTTNNIPNYITIKYSNITGVSEPTSSSPDKYELFQNYPNPFNPSTTLSFEISLSSFVSLKVYDVLGREVATLVNQEKPAGRYSVNFDASKLSSGVYFYKIKVRSFVLVKRMLFLK